MCVLLGFPASRASAELLYTITPLGTLGGNQSFATDISNLGQVTGNASRNLGTNFPLNAALWGPANPSSPANLGRLPGADADFSRSWAINDSGVVVGESSNNTPRAFRFVDANGNGQRDTGPPDEMIDLGTLGGASAAAHDINNNGLIVGASSNGTASRPFLFRDGAMRDLGTLDGLTNTPGRAWGINDAGQVVGFARTAVPAVSHAFLYTDLNGNNATDPGEMIDLDGPGVGDPNRFSQAFAINEVGQVVGEASVGSTQFGTSILNPFLWQNGTRTNLGTLGRTFGSALDINEAGLIVGNVTNISGSAERAFLWRDGMMADLNSLIDPASGWLLRSAEGINDRGQIAGFGTFGGQTRAFVLTPVPEPASVLSMTIGTFGLMLWVLRSRRRTLASTMRPE